MSVEYIKLPESHSQENTIVVYTLSDFLELKLPARSYLLTPIIPAQGLILLFATRGIGKTHLALSIALAIASGNDLFNWRCSKAHGVLYIDGEMAMPDIQERLERLVLGLKLNPKETFLRIITPDSQHMPLPDLATKAGQDVFNPYLKDVSFIVVDNLASLCNTGRENETESWKPVQRWLLDLRRRGISVLVVHHAGKSGKQRGTSAKEDLMDTIIELKHPSNYETSQGARFEIQVIKSRNCHGELIAPFEVQLQQEGDAFVWHYKKVHSEREIVKELNAKGISLREIEEQTGISKSRAQRYISENVK